MFGLFKSRKAPDEPVGLDFDIVIGRPPAEIYALIDFADPRCAKRQLGAVAEAGPGRFELRIDMLPDTVFDITVNEATPHRVYAFTCTSTPQVGKLLYDSERYEIQAQGGDACLVRLIVEAQFQTGMKKRVWAREVARMAQACEMTLAKLKLHAEQGLDAVREIERLQMA